LRRRGELASSGSLLGWQGGRVEVADETLSSEDLVLVCRCTRLFEALACGLLALTSDVLELLLTALLVTHLASLEIVLLESALLLVVGVLELLAGLVLRLLFGTCLVGLLAQRPEVLESLILLALETVQLSLKHSVLLAHGLLLGVVEQLLLVGDLCLDRVDILLLAVEASELLSCLVEIRNLRQGLLLVHQLHHAAVDLLLQTGDLLVDILDRLVIELALAGLELIKARLELLVELLDLLEDGVAPRLVALLGLADGIQFGLQLLLALSVRGVLVVGAGEVELGLAGVLCG
jgi:hypothetical protein